ncbi:Trans-2,3-dihydro-3-hydroxyanthranilate isomerase [Bacillus licheniformis]|jgi:phenazine biosynthesis protein PhzF family|uniref:Trans-2,3-dihydro-3-hydroxyanthranilate isomerase n=1 Tax=Bacillus licheniformis TaxID=1402 RepID=A0A8B5YED2_BACLI|nr:trans-2,3-dihydro-3-hydroxyanthranilateisomerase [Bacillus licheniformis]TWN08282.1 Trans-2,3-dihydro-3-hydroxyanthranilate isomerase [Bacillus licheniformis LMG 17339]AVI47984.1 Trans-2,3-dihydro-3-hydroxyanthranilate isomerase [Bacillus licheniformis]KJE32363.1 phenazine biosynthesis, PhzF family protein [Bacillus licheniformis]KYC79948.1 hypothetical protein B4091_0208 [Bacillus licheniformis]
MDFYLVDVFAETKYTGNQLAVFKAEKNLSSDEMQKIAREINFSETTFILGKQGNGGYDVRIFTPEKEIPFAGHPTLGTAFIIKNEIETEPSSNVILNVTAGAIPVTFEKGADQIIWMKQNPPVFNRTFDKEMMAGVIGIDTSDMDSNFPIQEVSTGLPAVIVPLNSLNAVKKCKINKDRFEAFMKETEQVCSFLLPKHIMNKTTSMHEYFATVSAFLKIRQQEAQSGVSQGIYCITAILINTTSA